MSFDRNAFVRRLWLAKLSRQLTANAYLIGRAMVRMAKRGGELWPSRAHLALEAGCTEKTVERAHTRLRDLGMLVWQTIRARWNRRAPNRYRLLTAKKEEESICESSTDKMSDGSADQAMFLAARSRLAQLLGVADGEVLPWMATGAGEAHTR
jgi:DNA-binding transcriptional regulator YhcF (GntR family)